MSSSHSFPMGWRKECQEHISYINPRGICVWQHFPQKELMQNTAVLLCPAVGYEYVHTYRIFRRLAELLCRSGFVVFRFDYTGTGDSAGNAIDPESFDNWLDDVVVVSKSIKEIYPSLKQCWVGLRLGGTLAMLAESKAEVDSLVLWEPILKGRRYIRELEMVSLMGANPKTEENSVLESAGFLLSRPSADNIKKINLVDSNNLLSDKDLLFVMSQDSPIESEFFEKLSRDNNKVTSYKMAGFIEMMAEPHNSVLPSNAVDYICSWLVKGAQTITAVEKLKLTDSDELYLNNDGQAVVESPHYFGSNDELFGILSILESEKEKLNKCIVLTNSGSVHHVGPNSLYSLVARELASIGYVVFRIDMGNIGDSLVVDKTKENHPYQPNSVQDVQSAMRYISQILNIDYFIVSGICSGAHTAFHAALSLKDYKVSEVLMINPLTLYWDENQSLDIPSTLSVFRGEAQYKQSLVSLSKWKKLFSGNVNVLHFAKFVIMRFGMLMRQIPNNIFAVIFGEKTRLALDIQKLLKNNIKVSFIFSEEDVSFNIVNADAKWTLKKGVKENSLAVEFVKDADHTFVSYSARDNLLMILRKVFGE